MVHKGVNFRTSCASNQPWKPSLNVGGFKMHFKVKEFVLLHKIFFSAKQFGDTQKIWGILPLNTSPRTTDQPEIKAMIKGTLPCNAPQGCRPALNKNIVLYIKCYVKQCCTEPSKPKAIRLYTHLNHLLFQVITFELEPPQVIQSIKRLVFSKTKLREVLPSSGLGLGPDEVGQKGQNYSTLWCHSQKFQNPKPKKFFFNVDSKNCQVFWGFE